MLMVQFEVKKCFVSNGEEFNSDDFRHFVQSVIMHVLWNQWGQDSIYIHCRLLYKLTNHISQNYTQFFGQAK